MTNGTIPQGSGGDAGTCEITISLGLPSVSGQVQVTSTSSVITTTVSTAAFSNSAVSDTFSILESALEIATVIGTPSLANTNSGPVTFTVTYTNADTVNLIPSLVQLNTTGTANAVVGVTDGATTTPTVTLSSITGDGTLGITILANTARNSSRNSPQSSASTTFNVDNTLPVVDISSPVDGTSINAPFTLTIDLTGEADTTPDQVTQDDLTLVNATVTNFSVMEGNSTTATVSPLVDGPVSVTLNANTVTDVAGNANAADTVTATYDNTKPTLNISTTSLNVNASFVATFTFSENVTGFDASDIVVTNGSKSSLTTNSPSSYELTITPSSEGNVVINVADDTAFDVANNGNTADDLTVNYDITKPSVVISTTANDPTNNSFTANFVFDEVVTGFVLGDIDVANGSASSLSGSGTTYSATITPASEGTVTIDVAAGVATDSAGNTSNAASQFSIEYDITNPTVSVTSTVTSPFNGSFDVDIVFNESVADFISNDITVTNGTVTSFSGSGMTYVATISPILDGNVTVDVTANVATDAAGNGNAAATTPFVVEYDITSPTTTISSSVTDPTNGNFTVDITFSENVNGFIASGITVGNGSVTSLTGSGMNYTATIAPTADGNVTVDVGANVATDDASNGNLAATQFSVEYDTTGPTATISSSVTDPTNGNFAVSIVFSEDVADFVANDITVGNGSVTALTGSGMNYSATIAPTADGTVTVDVGANVATDAAGNGNTAATQFSVEYDTTGPTATISSSVTDPTNGNFTVSIVFSEIVADFVANDITVGNGSVTALTGSGMNYSATIAPAADGNVTVDVGANVATDAAGNGNTAATQFSVEYDTTGPTATISSSVTDPTNGNFTVSIVFSEVVADFVANDITVGNGSVTALTGSGMNYSATIAPAADGNVTVDVFAGVATDAAGNGNTAATQFSVEYDTTGPTATISSSVTDPTNGNFTVSIVFSEIVADFVANDITVGNGSVTALTGSGMNYSATIAPAADGNVTVDVFAGVATDAAGNGNTAATQFSVEYDTTRPTATISSSVTDPTNGNFTVSIVFSEIVADFVANDITVGNGSVTALTGSGMNYSATIAPAADGNVTVDVFAGVATDAAGNGNTAATQFSVEYDTTGPTATISSSVTDPTNGNFTVSIVFSEVVADFVANDITVGNGSVTALTGSGMNYSATIAPAADGNVTVDVFAGVATDAAGNGNTAATQFSVEYDGTSPTVNITGPSALQKQAFNVSFTFSEAVIGFNVNDITATNAVVSNLSGSGTSYTANVTPSSDGEVKINLLAAVVTDTAGNANTAGTEYSVEYDGTVPTVTIAVSDAVVKGEFDVVVNFSEPVTGFELNELMVTNGFARSIGIVSSSSYQIGIDPDSEGPVTIQVPQGVALDNAGNVNTASAVASVTYAVSRPGVVVSAPTTANSDFTAMITFSEAVSDFVVADVQVTNGTVSQLVQKSGSVFEAQVTPSNDGDVTLLVPENVAKNQFDNLNTASNTVTVAFSTKQPSVAIAAPSSTNNSFVATITFSEDVTDFTLADVNVTNGVTDSFAAKTAAVYEVKITPSADGDVTIVIPQNSAQNAFGNGNTVSNTATVSYSTVQPSVTVSAPATASDSFLATVTFSEAVTGFTQGKVTVGNGVIESFVAKSTSVFEVTIKPSANGEVTIVVPQNSAQNAFGNGNTVSNTATVSYSTEQPSVTVSAPATANESFVATVTFSEAVTGFTQGKVTVGNGVIESFVAKSTSVFEVRIKPSANGEVTIDVPQNSAQNEFGNGNTAAEQVTVEFSNQRPVIVVSGPSTVTEQFEVEIAFSIAVTGFVASDVTVVNGDVVTLNANSDTQYVAVIKPLNEGDVIVSVNDDVAVDKFGNKNQKSNTLTVDYVTTRPAVNIDTPEAASEDFVASINFSENVSGFSIADITVQNATLSNFVQVSAMKYQVTVTGIEVGNITFDISENVALAANGLGNTAATQAITVFDNQAPSVETLVPEIGGEVSDLAMVFTVMFDETVTHDANQTIELFEDDNLVEQLSATQVTVTGNQVTLSLTDALLPGKTYRWNIAAGAFKDGLSNGSTAITNWTFTTLNTAPTAQADSAEVDEDTVVVIDVLANDTDEQNNIDPASVLLVTQPENGVAELDADTGKVKYTPAENFNGTDSFRYTVADTNDAISEETTVTVNVIPVNDEPVFSSSPLLEASVLSTYEYVIDVTDVDEDDIQLSLETAPDWLNLVDGVVSGVVPLDEAGKNVEIVIVASDGELSAAQEFMLTVTEFDDSQLLIEQAFTSSPILVNEGTVLNATVTNSSEVNVAINAVEFTFAGASVLQSPQSCSASEFGFICDINAELGQNEVLNFVFEFETPNVGELSSELVLHFNTDKSKTNNQVGVIVESVIDQAGELIEVDGVVKSELVDLNNDGLPDALFAHDTGISIFMNGGAGVFSLTQTLAIDGITDVAVTDFDAVNGLDIVFASNQSNSGVMFNDGTGQFGQTQIVSNIPASMVIAVDINLDQLIDLLYIDQSPLGFSIYTQPIAAEVAMSNVQASTQQRAVNVATGDFNGDDYADLVIGFDDGTVEMWINNENGEFNKVRLPIMNASQYAVADIDGDMKDDLIATSEQGLGYLLSSNDFGYQSISQNNYIAILVADVIDGDELELLALTAQHELIVFALNGDNARTIQAFIATTQATSLSVSDVDNDGDIDIMMNSVSGSSEIRFNQGNGMFGEQTTDIAITSSVSASEVEKGQSVTFDIIVTNDGLAVADDVVVNLGYSNLTITSVTAESLVCEQGSESISCTLASLAIGSSVSMTVVAQGLNVGNASLVGQVNTTRTDDDLNNNEATSAVSVIAVPTPPQPPKKKSSGGTLYIYALMMLTICVMRRRKYR